jgi:chromate transporter
VGREVAEVTAIQEERAKPGVKRLFLSFLRLGLTAFGGPSMVAYIGELAVKRHKWLDQETFKRGVALAQSIPGATAMQTAAYVGLRTRGIPGALATYVGFGLPAFLLMLILSWGYVRAGSLPWVVSLFQGLQVVVVAIIANATYTFGKGALKGYPDVFIALAAASAFGLAISPFYVIMGAALTGIGLLSGKQRNESPGLQATGGFPPLPFYQIFALCMAALAGLAFLYLTNRKLAELALLMLKIDLFAFGGGFASIPLMLQQIVNVRGWMDSKTFMDGIALGQVTPGPIVITSTFVGFLVHGLPGAVVATIAIFTPSLLLLVISTTFFDKLQRSAVFSRALRGILASFVGLLLYVTVKFAFAVPWNVLKVLVCAAALGALLKKVDIMYVVLVGAAISIVLF